MDELEELRKRLRSAERQMRDITGRVPDGILVLDSNGLVLFANPAVERLLGCMPGGLPGREFGFPAVAGETTEIDIPGPRGDMRLAEMRVVETEWEGAFAVVCVLRDITDRKRAESALRESEARYRQTFENAFTGNSVTSPAGELLACNRSFLRIFGFRSVEEAKARNVEDLYRKPSERRDFLERLRRQRTLESLEIEMRRADGRPVHIIENVFGSFSGDGELVSISSYLLDVSERKSLEEQLRQAQKMEAVGRLAGGLAHDFNNLLTVITGHAAMVRDSLPPGSDVRESMDEILGACERASGITGQLLAFSRKQLRTPVDVPIHKLVSDMNQLLRSAAGDAVRLRILADESAGLIRADRTQIEQVVLNLVVNSRDAMPGGGLLTVATDAVHLDDGYAAACVGVPPGHYARLTVRDTGHGMPDDVKAHVFEPFFTTKELGKGAGLGLSSVYGIVNQSGGGITVDSELGQGTTFRVYLPRVGDVVEAPASPAVPPRAAGGNETILVVDDEPAVRRLAMMILRGKGYRSMEAADPRDALRIAAQDPIDLLLTDIVMPEMGGRELAEQIRKLRPGVRVLYVSGFNEDEFFKTGLNGANAAFLIKPFTPEILERHVREVLNRPA